MKGSRNPLSGGLFLAIGAVGGALWGGRNGIVVSGVLLGLAIGAALALLIWLIDRTRG